MCEFELIKIKKDLHFQCEQILRFSAKPADFGNPLRIFKPQLRNPQILPIFEILRFTT